VTHNPTCPGNPRVRDIHPFLATRSALDHPMSEITERRRRAEERRARLERLVREGGAWAGGLVRPEDDVPPVGRTVSERLRMVMELSLRGHELAHGPIRRLPRSQWPGRVIRLAEDR